MILGFFKTGEEVRKHILTIGEDTPQTELPLPLPNEGYPALKDLQRVSSISSERSFRTASTPQTAIKQTLVSQ